MAGESIRGEVKPDGTRIYQLFFEHEDNTFFRFSG